MASFDILRAADIDRRNMMVIDIVPGKKTRTICFIETEEDEDAVIEIKYNTYNLRVEGGEEEKLVLFKKFVVLLDVVPWAVCPSTAKPETSDTTM